MHSSLPFHFYVWVNNKDLGPDMPEGHTQAILHGVYGKSGQQILTHILLETGAHWSGIPLSHLKHKITTNNTFGLQPWGCMGSDITSTHFPYLDGLIGIVISEQINFRHTGIIIDWNDGYSRYPQEHKPLSLLALENGNFALLPNNYFKIYDKHFTEKLEHFSAELKKYKRGEIVYWETQ